MVMKSAFKMSRVSLRPVHVIRWCVVALAILGLLFWLWERREYHIEEAQRLSGPNARDIKPPSLRNVGRQFTLDGQHVLLLGGSLHYFRVVPEYWRDRMIKMKACGLNTITTYVPWNMHEEVRGEFEFSGILDIVAFLRLAMELNFYVILRPGPYICAEWDFGGLPSWLLHDPDMKIRSTYPLFVDAVERYFDRLLPLVTPYQYHLGGPIIAVQVENEYGHFGSDVNYMIAIKEMLVARGVKEMLVTSDQSSLLKEGSVPGALMTANFQKDAEKHFEKVKKIQGDDMPLMVMEFWPGWFDHWTEQHHIYPSKGLIPTIKDVLQLGASINFYMFHGGTNFGFWNGANIVHQTYQPDVTSYDYDAPLSEAGDATEKYFKIKALLKQESPKGVVPDHLPNVPATGKIAYGEVTITHFITLEDTLPLLGAPVKSEIVMPMEMLPINNNGGQGYGYVLYRTKVKGSVSKLDFVELPHDRAQVFLNGHSAGVVSRTGVNSITLLNLEVVKKELKNLKSDDEVTLDILVENQGRTNFGKEMISERKGLLKDVEVNKKVQKDWVIYPLEFKKPFMEGVMAADKWQNMKPGIKVPALYKGSFEIPNRTPKDTFLSMEGWDKGIVFVNGFNIGRYWKEGPQTTYYVPGPLLKAGRNEIVIFEQHGSAGKVSFVDKHDLGPTVRRDTWNE
ncbi:beta-galactosidase-1-like protein 2 [Anneissia japonica]|uniref:beta-galactosidase-1-like protein 2 n=1 Tax=Anneissia japonica TaxID=1529436 RepID=UPI001425A516|nr:beta-galactosidase-1-like protein 2 [Anneissia japonica]XP_033107749.1 beta-galactosidase-1-like protein 2 [Anneissia japonica]